jgi:hypothetical protein
MMPIITVRSKNKKSDWLWEQSTLKSDDDAMCVLYKSYSCWDVLGSGKWNDSFHRYGFHILYFYFYVTDTPWLTWKLYSGWFNTSWVEYSYGQWCVLCLRESIWNPYSSILESDQPQCEVVPPVLSLGSVCCHIHVIALSFLQGKIWHAVQKSCSHFYLLF